MNSKDAIIPWMDFSFTWDKISRILWHVMLPKQAMHCHSSYFTLLTSWKCFHWFHFRINLSKPGCKLLVCDTFWTKLRHRCNSATNYNADECLQLKVSICNIETSSHFKRNYTKNVTFSSLSLITRATRAISLILQRFLSAGVCSFMTVTGMHVFCLNISPALKTRVKRNSGS